MIEGGYVMKKNIVRSLEVILDAISLLFLFCVWIALAIVFSPVLMFGFLEGRYVPQVTARRS